MIIGVIVHILGAIVWVGGMFFAYVELRPVTGELEPAPRLALWRGVLARFFPLVWASVIGLLASGYGMLFQRAVTQADKGCDFDFLEHGPPTAEPGIF